jgi:hypothetical protein
MNALGFVLLVALGGVAPVVIPFERARPEERAEVRAGRSATAGVRLEREGDRFGLLVTLGEQRTGGYAIKVQRIVLSRATLEVHVGVTRPGKGDMVTQAFTYPLDFVWIPAKALAGAGERIEVRAIDQSGKVLATSGLAHREQEKESPPERAGRER